MIEVISPGFYSTIQDLGRFGFGEIGVPISGVMDQYAAKVANHILDNKEDDSLLEITFSNVILKFKNQTVILISGADFSPTLNTKSIPLNASIRVQENDVLAFGKVHYGARSYLAIKGGFLTEKILHSRSYFNGVTKQIKIAKNDLLPHQLDITHIEKSNARIKISHEHFYTKSIDAYEGPEYHLLNDNQKKQLKEVLFTISKENNRMGYRLEELIENNLAPILTSAVMPGVVQLTPSGKLIILMRDCQVTGGYPRVLVVSKNAINQLAQKSTGDTFKFKIESL